MIVQGAVHVDTTHLTLDEAIEAIVALVTAARSRVGAP